MSCVMRGASYGKPTWTSTAEPEWWGVLGQKWLDNNITSTKSRTPHSCFERLPVGASIQRSARLRFTFRRPSGWPLTRLRHNTFFAWLHLFSSVPRPKRPACSCYVRAVSVPDGLGCSSRVKSTTSRSHQSFRSKYLTDKQR